MKRSFVLFACVWLFGSGLLRAADSASPTFRAVEIDAKIEIGYGVAIADVDGDKKPDIILADKKQIVWYKNPGWEKFTIAENLTTLDNVCVAAADLDGDGKAEIAAGAGWNPSDTVNSGAVFYLKAPPDRTQKWQAIELPHEPTVHRMKWVITAAGKWQLVVVPLHGRGNKDGKGAGAKILAYQFPSNVDQPWPTSVVNDSMHLTHNFDLVKWSRTSGDELLVAGREGVFHFIVESNGWKSWQLVGKREGDDTFQGVGEVRSGKLAGADSFLAAIEPMHGNRLVIYTAPRVNDVDPLWKPKVLDTGLKEGHALACADFAGAGFDQVVVGWRAKNSDGKVGIKVFTPTDKTVTEWTSAWLDEDTMACEDLCVGDLNGDGKLDIVASGRATKNLKVYFNTSSASRK